MNRHVDFDTLQDYAEGLLSAEEHEKVRAHLEACAECQKESAALDSVLEAVAGLPTEAEPSRDLWPQIEWRMGSGDGVDAAGGKARKRGPRTRITFTAWQLLAASVALALISGGVVWTALSGGSQATVQMATSTGPDAFVSPAGWETTFDGYDEAVTDLEAVFEAGRNVLDPETLQVLETTLETIDQAIRESQEALAQDPGSRFLGRLLTENMRRKMTLLRHAATAVYANT